MSADLPTACTLADLMAMFGYRDPQRFRVKLRALMDGAAFPKPLPYTKNRWSRAEVSAWMATPSQRANDTATPTTKLQSRIAEKRKQVATRATQGFELISGGKA
jgi:predicted DNA-binding transcriptional regulator AlpA